MQHRFVVKLLTAAKEMGVHTALDTNGFFGERLSDAELDVVDLVLLDIKAWDPDRHRQLTGMEIAPTLTFASRVAALRRPIWLRYVLVPGWTDDLGDISRIANFAAGLGTVERVDVLPFHQMGKYKWHQLGLTYLLENVVPPAADMVERTCDAFRSAGLNAH
jgi:pyruvate formate lyase activating enzyme